MRSPAERAAPGRGRAVLEWTLRLVVLSVVAWLLWRELRPRLVPEPPARRGAPTAAALGAWTRDPVAAAVHAELDAPPSDTVRAWLAALRAAGVGVSWASPATPSLPPIAVAAEPLADPAGAVRVLVAAPAGDTVVVGDALGTLDTLVASAGGASVVVRSVGDAVHATDGASRAAGDARDSLLLRPVLVLGRAGWEARFTTLALEERGWTVVARMPVAPGVEVAQGTVGALDTARYAAVVALDTTAAGLAPAIARFVRQGGGLVLAPGALGVPALAALAPARVGQPLAAPAAALAGDEPRRGLPLHPLVALRDGAVSLERRDGRVAVAAHRVGAGRVVLVGYADSWRWRMAGPDGAPTAHRAWWAGALRAAAHAPLVAGAPAPSLDDAPVARLIAALGPAGDAPADAAPIGAPSWPWWLLPLLAAALLVEWVSRRARGAR